MHKHPVSISDYCFVVDQYRSDKNQKWMKTLEDCEETLREKYSNRNQFILGEGNLNVNRKLFRFFFFLEKGKEKSKWNFLKKQIDWGLHKVIMAFKVFK